MTAAELPEGGIATGSGRPWLRLGAALLCGVLAATALPPFYFLPGLWIGFSGLLYLIVSATGWKRAALEGWIFGVGWFAFGLYWIGYAFLVDAAQHAFLMPFAVIGISVGMAIYPALAAGSTSWLIQRASLPVIFLPLLFAAIWTVAEWLRGIVLTGFPWNPVASIWGVSDEILQSISWLSALGLGFVTIAVSAAPAILVLCDAQDRRRSWTAMVLLTASLPLLWGGGLDAFIAVGYGHARWSVAASCAAIHSATPKMEAGPPPGPLAETVGFEQAQRWSRWITHPCDLGGNQCAVPDH